MQLIHLENANLLIEKNHSHTPFGLRGSFCKFCMYACIQCVTDQAKGTALMSHYQNQPKKDSQQLTRLTVKWKFRRGFIFKLWYA